MDSKLAQFGIAILVAKSQLATVGLTVDKVIEAWRNPEIFEELTAEQKEVMLKNPAGDYDVAATHVVSNGDGTLLTDTCSTLVNDCCQTMPGSGCFQEV